ncbi:hypothetical protein R8Z50_24530 [Longispora sp. K20-0274]|uniref:hypothetical protein n=1 Tax=Longispora sp. K20-0274 TaxID=3088255 RepID=UPI00399BB171
MRVSPIALAAATVAAFGATLVAAAPAQASTGILDCESWSSTIWCSVSGPATTVKWTVNGNYAPAYDNKYSISFSCLRGYSNTVKAVKTYNGVPSTETRSIVCSALPPR